MGPTFFVTSTEWRECTYQSHAVVMPRGLARAGVSVVDVNEVEELTRLGRVPRQATVMTLVNPPGSHFLDAFEPDRRWLVTVDEGPAARNMPYRKQVDRCRKWDMRGVVTTYANSSHLQVLADAGLKHVTLPHCIDGERPRHAGKRGIILSGNHEQHVYPERFRLVNALGFMPRQLAFLLMSPGSDAMNPRGHRFVHDTYMNLLDKFDMGVVDKVGACDRLVSKYTEFAACGVLPIGDFPSYMPPRMREAMVVSTDFRTDDDLRTELLRLLETDRDELEQRRAAYVSAALEAFRLDTNVARLLAEMGT